MKITTWMKKTANKNSYQNFFHEFIMVHLSHCFLKHRFQKNTTGDDHHDCFYHRNMNNSSVSKY